MNNIKILLSILLGMIGAFFGQYGVVILLVSIAICFDCATGFVRAKITGSLNSKKGYTGFFKKIALLLSLFFAIFFDFFVPILTSVCANVNLSYKLPFGVIMGVYIIINESISIFENLYECKTPMPKALIKILKLANDSFNSNDE